MQKNSSSFVTRFFICYVAIISNTFFYLLRNNLLKKCVKTAKMNQK